MLVQAEYLGDVIFLKEGNTLNEAMAKLEHDIQKCKETDLHILKNPESDISEILCFKAGQYSNPFP